jgi:hypothetical protein
VTLNSRLRGNDDFPFLQAPCSFNVRIMKKSRRLADIRAHIREERQKLREIADARAAFLKPKPKSWHDVFLQAIREGGTLRSAAEEAGITRAGVHYARGHDPNFDAAFARASLAGAAARRGRRRPPNHVITLTTRKNASSIKRPSDIVSLVKSGLTYPEAFEAQRQRIEEARRASLLRFTSLDRMATR